MQSLTCPQTRDAARSENSRLCGMGNGQTRWQVLRRGRRLRRRQATCSGEGVLRAPRGNCPLHQPGRKNILVPGSGPQPTTAGLLAHFPQVGSRPCIQLANPGYHWGLAQAYPSSAGPRLSLSLFGTPTEGLHYYRLFASHQTSIAPRSAVPATWTAQRAAWLCRRAAVCLLV